MKVKSGEKLMVGILIALVATGGFPDGQKHEAFPTDRYVAPPEPEKWRMGEFVREGQTIYACWSVEGEVKIDCPSALDGAKFLDLMGNEIPAPKTEDGKLHLDDSPVYAVCTH